MSDWGLPPDAVAWVCAGLALALALACRKRERFERWLLWPRATLFVTVSAVVAALLSLGYVWFYLGGAPRIIDATSYALSAKMFASGNLSFDANGPLASFHSRFLYANEARQLAPLFPPGYPLALATTTALGLPMLLGPVLAGLLTLVTYHLARRLSGSEEVARLSTLASVFCAALRYHTADTMSHGFVALLFAGVVLFSWQQASVKRLMVAGLLLAWLFACRPLTGVVATLVVLVCLGMTPRRWLILLPVAALGPVGFLVHQWAITRRWGEFVQHAYYRTADGPPGCVRLGFGEDVGCRVEHHEFIQRYMPEGYGLVEALSTTGRRLFAHLADAGNVELLFPLVLVGLWRGLPKASSQPLAVALALQVAAYATFYFDGNYPGGGARLFADVLVFEHVLIAAALAYFGGSRWLIPSMLLGFAIHTSHGHAHLSARDGGRPMYEADLVPDDAQLVFLDTDHGFNLAHSGTNATPSVARLRRDGFDWALWTSLGRPDATYLYDFDLSGRRPPSVLPYRPTETFRFFSVSNWPAWRVSEGWIEPVPASATCRTGSPWLALHPNTGAAAMTLEIELWVTEPGEYQLELRADRELELDIAAARRTRPTEDPCLWSSESFTAQRGALPLKIRTREHAAVHHFELVPGGHARR